MPALSARERALLVLRSLRDGTPEDPKWRSTMPAEQAREFNRYIDLMNVANGRLAFLITFIEGEVGKLGIFRGWLLALLLWEMNLTQIEFAASVVAREPITRSEYEQLVLKAEGEYLPVEMLAKELVEERRNWADEDLEEVGWSQQLVVRDEAWARLCREAEAELRQAAKVGEIEARGSGKRLRLKRASFDAWLVRPVTVFPDWAGGYDVMPDERWAHVESGRSSLRELREAIEEPLKALTGQDDKHLYLSSLKESVEQRLVRGMELRWVDLQLAEMLVAEIADAFDGEDPLKPATREALDKTRQELEELFEHARYLGLSMEKREPTEEELEESRESLGTR